MIRTQIYITTQEKKALTQIALHTGESQSELIRKTIDLLCQSNQTSAKKIINRYVCHYRLSSQ